MKRKVLLTVAVAMVWTMSAAQGIVMGEKIPDLRTDEWVGSRKPVATPERMMLIEFFHPANQECLRRLAIINEWAEKYPSALTVAVISRENTPEALEALKRLSPRCYIGIDTSGRTFGAFGVQYVPYGVITDPKGRVIWMGNSTRMTENDIKENIEYGIFKDRPLRKAPPAGKNR